AHYALERRLQTLPNLVVHRVDAALVELDPSHEVSPFSTRTPAWRHPRTVSGAPRHRGGIRRDAHRLGPQCCPESNSPQVGEEVWRGRPRRSPAVTTGRPRRRRW